MEDQAGRAARRAAQLENQAEVGVDIGRDMDGGDQYLGHRMGRLWKKWLGLIPKIAIFIYVLSKSAYM